MVPFPNHPGHKQAMRFRYDNEDDRLLRWVCGKIGVRSLMDGARAIGVENDAGNILAVVAYDRFTDGDCCAHIAYDKEQGLIPPAFWTVTHAYPYVTMDLVRTTALMRDDNPAAIAFAERQGYVYEGRIRKGDIDADLVLYGLLREESPFLKRDYLAKAGMDPDLFGGKYG